MKTNKITILLLLALLMSMLLIPVSADNDVVESGDWGGGNVLWQITSDGTLTLEGPRYMQGATNGKFPWKEHTDKVTRIVVKDGLTDIAPWAFTDMVNVKTVELGQTIQSIGEYAFRGCTALESIHIPLNVKELEGGAFFLCENLTTVTFDEHCALTEIGGGAFQKTGLTSLTLPSRITTIGSGAFYECKDLVSVKFNEGLQEVGAEAFRECISITSLTIPSTLNTIREDAFRGLEKLTHLELYTNIDYERDFPWCGPVKSVVIHAPMTNVSGFENCTTLETVILADTVTTISENAFTGCTALKQIDWPASLTTIESFAFAHSGLVSAILPDTVTQVESSAFRSCPELKEFKASPAMTQIGNCTFMTCPALENVELGNVTAIGFEAFNGCTALTGLTLPDGLESIGYQGFNNCTALREITIPASVRNLDHSMFAGCTALETVRFLGDAPVIGEYSFRGVTAAVYYPAGNATWTGDVIRDYYGTLTWIPEGGQDLSGDLDGSGEVDADDAIWLLYHTLFGDLYPVSGHCDFDGSGTVDADDAIYLLYHTLFGADLYPLGQGGDVPLFTGALDTSTSRNETYQDTNGQTLDAAYIEMFACGDSGAAQEKIRQDFAARFGFEPTADIQVEVLGTFRVEGYTEPQEITRYAIWDTTYPLLQHPMYDVFTQTLADGTLWVGYCAERSEYDHRDEKQWYADRAWQMRNVLGEHCGIPTELVDSSGMFELDCAADGGTFRTTAGTVVELVWIYCQYRG